MKKILLLIATIGAGFMAANAQEQTPLVIAAGQLKKLDLGNDLKVTLVRADDPRADVKGATAIFEKLSVSVENGTMHIRSRAKLNEADKVVVVVGALEKLVVGENTQVNTQGILSANNMKVFVQEGARARIVTNGQVTAFPVDDVKIKVTRQPVQLDAAAKVR